MYAYLRGKVSALSTGSVIIECHGVGYCVQVSATALSNMPDVGKELQLFTSFIVREQLQALYGFCTVEERDFFEELLDVTGIGPRTALSLIGHLPPSRLKQVIHQQDCVALSKIPGIGKKTAQRLILEMQDKNSIKGALQPSEWALKFKAKGQVIQDAMSALIHLGYTQSVAEKALRKALDRDERDMDLSALITTSLQYTHSS